MIRYLCRSVGALLVATFAGLVAISEPAGAEPPNIPSANAALAMLESLTFAPEFRPSRYSRGQFLSRWATFGGGCTTRALVLQRDSENVGAKGRCTRIPGPWLSPYDGIIHESSADLEIDHLVPLAEAWSSGAWAWTGTQRRAFANDLQSPELWAVTGALNQEKVARDPAEWMPPLSSFRCTYAEAWVQVKYSYRLTVDEAEKLALSGQLARC